MAPNTNPDADAREFTEAEIRLDELGRPELVEGRLKPDATAALKPGATAASKRMPQLHRPRTWKIPASGKIVAARSVGPSNGFAETGARRPDCRQPAGAFDAARRARAGRRPRIRPDTCYGRQPLARRTQRARRPRRVRAGRPSGHGHIGAAGALHDGALVAPARRPCRKRHKRRKRRDRAEPPGGTVRRASDGRVAPGRREQYFWTAGRSARRRWWCQASRPASTRCTSIEMATSAGRPPSAS